MKNTFSESPDNADCCKEIGQRLAEIRRSKKISQIEVAKALNISQSSLSQFECGQRMWQCPAVIRLIKYYKVPYEDVFGEIKTEKNESPIRPDEETYQPVALLERLADAVRSEELSRTVRAYIYVSVYRLLRALYESNPRNSSAIFRLERSFADRFTADFLTEEPDRISANVSSSRRINKLLLELPVELSSALRAAIAKCEDFITAFNSQEPG